MAAIFKEETMFAYSSRTRQALVLTLVVVFIAPAAFARITLNTIDPFATIKTNGRQIIVTGPVECTAGETFDVRVTVTQRATGALAEGHTRFKCSGATQHWLIDAKTHGREAFQPEAATAAAVGITSSRGQATDSHQWLVNITLISQ